MQKRDMRWARGLLVLAVAVVGSGGLARGETVPVRADDGTVVCSLTLPSGWEFVATSKAPPGTGRWQPRDSASLWGVPLGENGGGNTLVNRGAGVSVAALSLGSASCASEAVNRLTSLIPDFPSVEVPLGEAARQALDTRKLQYAAYLGEEESMLLALGTPGRDWVALLAVATSDRSPKAELERLLGSR